jgi:uncharacterized protein with PQ loop repeat
MVKYIKMRALIDPLFIYIFLITLLYMKLPDIDNDNYIEHKIYIFLSIFVFGFMLQTIKRIRSKCVVKTEDMLFDSFKTAVAGILGYSIYTDLIHMESTKEYFENLGHSVINKIAIVALIIVAFIVLAKVIEMVLLSKESDCS